MFGFGKKKHAEEAEKAAIDKAVAEEIEETNVEVEELKERRTLPRSSSTTASTARTTLKKSPPKTSKTTSTWVRCASSCSTA